MARAAPARRRDRAAPAPAPPPLRSPPLWRREALLWLLLAACAALFFLHMRELYAAGRAPDAAVRARGLRVAPAAEASSPGAQSTRKQPKRTLLHPALDADEIARQRALLAQIAAGEYSAERPFKQAAGRPPVLYAADAPSADDITLTSPHDAFCARGAAFFAALPHAPECEICDEHAHASRYLFERYFSHSSWRGRGVYIESGALDGQNGAQSLFFDEVLRWRGLLIEGNPPNFARALVRRPHAVRLECALCASEDGDVEFVGDYGGVVGAAAAMGDELRSVFHGERTDRYNVSCCTLRTYWPLAGLGPRVDVWFLDVEGSELAALRAVDWATTDVWLILIEMNPAAGASHLTDIRAELSARGFAFVDKQGAMNELFENARARPDDAGRPGDELPCDWGAHPPPYERVEKPE